METINQSKVAASIAAASASVNAAATAFNRLREVSAITTLSVREIGNALHAHKHQRERAPK